MSQKQILERMSFIISGNEFYRVKIEERNDIQYVIVDLHGMSCREANRIVRSIIAMFLFPFVLVLIHGYNSGTALKEMIRNSVANPRIQSKQSPSENPGITYVTVL